jgi:predicted RNase H-like HicB family nuclease
VSEYLVVLERGETSWGAFVPDLPGCIAVAETLAECKELIAEAVEMHIEGMKEAGEPIPEPTSEALRVKIAA